MPYSCKSCPGPACGHALMLDRTKLGLSQQEPATGRSSAQRRGTKWPMRPKIRRWSCSLLTPSQESWRQAIFWFLQNGLTLPPPPTSVQDRQVVERHRQSSRPVHGPWGTVGVCQHSSYIPGRLTALSCGNERLIIQIAPSPVAEQTLRGDWLPQLSKRPDDSSSPRETAS